MIYIYTNKILIDILNDGDTFDVYNMLYKNQMLVDFLEYINVMEKRKNYI